MLFLYEGRNALTNKLVHFETNRISDTQELYQRETQFFQIN